MRIGPGVRAAFLILVLLAVGAALYLFRLSTETETAYIFAADMQQYDFIANNSEEFLLRVSVPKSRDFDVVTNPGEIVGMYLNQPTYANQLIHREMLIDSLPDGRRRFPRALLPENTEAYPVNIPEIISGVFTESDLVNIYVIIDIDNEPSADDTGVLLFQKVTTLGIIDGKFMVALTPEQIMAYEGWQRIEGVSFTASISQDANWDFPPLQPFPLYPDYNSDAGRELFARPTPTPMPNN